MIAAGAGNPSIGLTGFDANVLRCEVRDTASTAPPTVSELSCHATLLDSLGYSEVIQQSYATARTDPSS